MSQEVLKGQWNELKGKVKEWWGDLTEDDVNKIDGNHDKLVGVLQQRYGYAKERALSEISRRIDEFGKKTKPKA